MKSLKASPSEVVCDALTPFVRVPSVEDGALVDESGGALVRTRSAHDRGAVLGGGDVVEGVSSGDCAGADAVGVITLFSNSSCSADRVSAVVVEAVSSADDCEVLAPARCREAGPLGIRGVAGIIGTTGRVWVLACACC